MPSSPQTKIPYLYGIRGVSSLLVVVFHLNYMLLGVASAPASGIYHTLTDWLRYGDYRVAAFFVISGYLLTLPTTRSADWRLSRGIGGFLHRRVQRLIWPYYVALVLSTILFVAWLLLSHQHLAPLKLTLGFAAHVLLVHNLSPRTALFINDTLWNVALEFQCYVLFAFVLLPIMRRYGPFAQLAFATIVGLAPHFFFHGFLDCTRPWFVTLYAMGVAVAALRNPAYPKLNAIERRLPWGSLTLVFVALAATAIVLGGKDIDYGAGWFQNVLLGLGVASLLVYTKNGLTGPVSRVIGPVVHGLSWRPLTVVGRFSYSTYLSHFPILRLMVALTALVTPSFPMIAAMAFFVWTPLTIALAYRFHVAFELPFQDRREGAAAEVESPALVDGIGATAAVPASA